MDPLEEQKTEELPKPFCLPLSQGFANLAFSFIGGKTSLTQNLKTLLFFSNPPYFGPVLSRSEPVPNLLLFALPAPLHGPVPPDWTIPSNWTPGQASSMRLASYKVNDEEGNELDFSVTSFPVTWGTPRQRKSLAWSNRRTTNRRGRLEEIRPTGNNRRHIGPISRSFIRGQDSLRRNPYERRPFLVLQTYREQITCRKGKEKLLRLP